MERRKTAATSKLKLVLEGIPIIFVCTRRGGACCILPLQYNLLFLASHLGHSSQALSGGYSSHFSALVSWKKTLGFNYTFHLLVELAS